MIKTKANSKQLVAALKEINLFTLKFCILDHILENLLRLIDFRILDVSVFEHFNYTIESINMMIPTKKSASTEEAFKWMTDSDDV